MGEVGATSRHLGAVAVAGRPGRHRVGERRHRFDVCELRVASAEHLQRLLAHVEQPPAPLDVGPGDQPQAARAVLDRRLVGEGLDHVRGSPRVVLGCVAGIAGTFVVLRRGREQARAEHAGVSSQPVGGARVRGALHSLQHRVVGDLVQDLVAEGVLADAVGGSFRALPGLDKRARAERRQLARRVGIDVHQGPVPERHADHAGELQGPALRRWQTVEPRLQHAGQGRRHVQRAQPLRVERPAPVADRDRAWSTSIFTSSSM
jgi:hypothetical protein